MPTTHQWSLVDTPKTHSFGMTPAPSGPPAPAWGDGLAAWFSADTGITLDGGGLVAKWEPAWKASGNPFFEPDISGLAPTIDATAVNGKPAVSFIDANNNVLKCVDGFGFDWNRDEFTVVMVRRMNQGMGLPQMRYTLLSAPGLLVQTRYVTAKIGGGSTSFVGTNVDNDPDCTAMWTGAISGQGAATLLQSWQGNVAKTTIPNPGLMTRAATLSSGAVDLGIDLQNFPTTPNPATVYLAEIILFSKALDQTQVDAIYAAMQAKYPGL